MLREKFLQKSLSQPEACRAGEMRGGIERKRESGPEEAVPMYIRAYDALSGCVCSEAYVYYYKRTIYITIFHVPA